MQTFYLLSGLPRSGSTLLSSILNQNPDFYASPNSPVIHAVRSVHDNIVFSEQYQAYPQPDNLKNSLLGVIGGYYKETNKKYILDKSRDWSIPENLNIISGILPYKPKLIIMVRDILDILASFINLANQNEGKHTMLDSKITTDDYYFYRPPNDIRCDYLMAPRGPIDGAMYGIANALSNENRSHTMIIEYENFISDAPATMNAIYDFLELPRYGHNFENIINTVKENDEVYGLIGMHDVRPTIAKRELDRDSILSDYVINKYSNLEFWRNQ